MSPATPWGAGLNLIQPILNFGRIQSQINAADARQRQAFLNYQQTVLEALGDMEDQRDGAATQYRRQAGLTPEARPPLHEVAHHQHVHERQNQPVAQDG